MDFFVGDYGAVGNGTTDDTTAFQDTINAAAVNGGTVVCDGDKTYRTTNWLIAKPLVSLDGQGCTILVDHTSNFVLADSHVNASTRLTADVAAGDNVLHVSSTTGFSVGGLIHYALDEDAGDAAETTYFGFARVLALTSTTLTLDINLPRATSGVTSYSSPTNDWNKIVKSIDAPIENVSYKNYNLVTKNTVSNPAPAIYEIFTRNVVIKNVKAYNFYSLLYSVFCDNIEVSNTVVQVDRTMTTRRAVSCSECTNVLVDNLLVYTYTEDFVVIYAEASSFIRATNIKLNNRYSSSTGGLFYASSSANSRSSLRVDGLTIVGKGGWTLRAGGGDFIFRDVTLDIDADVAAGGGLPYLFMRGILRQNIAGAGWSLQNFDRDLNINNNSTSTGSFSLYSNIDKSLQRFVGVLTGNITATLDTASARIDDVFHIIMPASLGGHTFSVVGSSTTSFSANDWVRYQFDGSAWQIVARGNVA